LKHMNSSFSTDSVSDINQCYGQWVIDENRSERYVSVPGENEYGYSNVKYVGCSIQKCGHMSEFVGKFSNVNQFCETDNNEQDPFIAIYTSQSVQDNRHILPEDTFGKCTEIDCTTTIPECYYFEHSNPNTLEDNWSNCEYEWNVPPNEGIYNSAWNPWSNCSENTDDNDCRFDRTRVKYSSCNEHCPTHELTGAYWSCGSNLQLDDICRKHPVDECGSNEFEHRLECSTTVGSVKWIINDYSNATCQYLPIDCTFDVHAAHYSNFCSFGKTYIQLSEPKLFGGECSNEGWTYQNPIYSGNDTNFVDVNSNLTLVGYSNIKGDTIEDRSINTYKLRISSSADDDSSNVHFPYGHLHSNCYGGIFDLCTENSHCENDLVCDTINQKCKINTGYILDD